MASLDLQLYVEAVAQRAYCMPNQAIYMLPHMQGRGACRPLWLWQQACRGAAATAGSRRAGHLSPAHPIYARPKDTRIQPSAVQRLHSG